ncbi:hypothetical protein ACFL4K_03555 [Candidatus Neomarinimicrobiota bacterium]
MRSLLIIILGGLLVWLILRLSRTVKDVMPGKPREQSSPISDTKIIDAEFEEVNKEENSEAA